jgi:hypothetical protein
MQQLKIEHKKTVKKKKDRRESKGRVLAISRRIYRLRQNTDTFYVESESSDDQYYFVKFKPDVLESSLWYCLCKDNSTRHIKCKHLFAIEFAIKWGIIKDIDTLPPTATPDVKEDTIQEDQISKSYKDDDYTF